MATPPTFEGFANYVAQVTLAAQTGTVASIPNALATAGLDTAILTNPVQIRAYKESIAGQMNDQSGGPRFEDLADRIADVITTTTAQGAGTLEVHIIDPLWAFVNEGFIQVDEIGFLWPPIDVNFPSGTDCVWRLCNYKPSWNPNSPGANLVLTFEDRIVSLLREISPGNGGVQQGLPNQTLSEFFKMLVDSANKILKPNPPITYVPLVAPADPNATVPVTQLPARAESKVRPKGLDAQMQALLSYIDSHFKGKPVTTGLGAFPTTTTSAQSSTMTAAEQNYVAQWAAYSAELERSIARGDSNLAIPIAAP